MKVTSTHKHHRTENGKVTLCGIRLNSYSDIVNENDFSIPTKFHSYQFNPYPVVGEICKKCNESIKK